MPAPIAPDADALKQFAARTASFLSRYGYETYDTAIIQPAEVFLTRAGDQIADQLFTFEQRGAQYALRPEFTASAAAMYAQAVNETPDYPPIARWQFAGWVFADQPNEAAQQFSLGAELFGFPGAYADAEIIHLASAGLSAHGLTQHRVEIGNVRLMRLMLGRFGLDPRAQRFLLNHLADLADPARGREYVVSRVEQLMIPTSGDPDMLRAPMAEAEASGMYDLLLDATGRGTTMGGRTRQDIVRRLMHKQQRTAERGQFMAALDFLEAWRAIDAEPEAAFDQMGRFAEDAQAQALLAEWREAIELLGVFTGERAEIRIRPALARNWDYYTDMVFELHTSDGIHLGGGGRYDELAQLFGADQPVSAVGFAYYADDVLRALAGGHPNSALTSALRIGFTPQQAATAIHWGAALRAHDIAVQLVPVTASGLQTAFISGDALHFEGVAYTLDDMTTLQKRLLR